MNPKRTAAPPVRKAIKTYTGTSDNHPGNPLNNPYQRELAGNVAGKKKVIIDLNVRTAYLTKKDIGRWRMAWQAAINVENPRRVELLDIYTDCMIDNHLMGAVRNRVSSLMRKTFRLIDIKNGKEDEQLTELFEKRWFKQFQVMAMDSIFWGPTLVEFGNIELDPIRFTHSREIDRKHVIPEYSVIVQNQWDDIRKGIPFNEPPWSNWTMLIYHKNEKDLGLLLNVAPQAIAKKNAMAFWDKFAEIFGMPIRFATSAERDARNRNSIENMLENMGSAAWGLFPEGTDIELIESSRGDAFQVYDERIERANSEMSKAVVGTTMLMDEGSSRSQSEVHEKVSKKVEEEDADFIRDLVNERLLPFLQKHGFPVQNRRLEWVENIDYTPEQQRQIEEMVLRYYNVDPDYFLDKYNIPVQERRAYPGLSMGDPDFFVQAPHMGGTSRKVSELYAGCTCAECGGHTVTMAHAKKVWELVSDSELDKQAEAIARAIYEGKTVDFSPAMAKRVASKLTQAISAGFGKNIAEVATDAIDYGMIQNLQRNVYQFSAAKNWQQLRELTNLVRDGERLRSFADFQRQAEQLNLLYNRVYLQTEYELAVAGSQNASRWVNQGNESILEYRTAQDERVRDSHKALHGVRKKKSDPFWDVYYPPNGYRCRCLAVESADTRTPETSEGDIVAPQVPDMFRTNLARRELIFPADHPYFEGPPADLISNATDLLK